jgi:hypothetical protein
MIDDMQGLFSHASEAYRAGMIEGRRRVYEAASLAVSRVGSKYETGGDAGAFRAAEECSAALREAKEEADRPKHETR